jgi:hypothetical protein
MQNEWEHIGCWVYTDFLPTTCPCCKQSFTVPFVYENDSYKVTCCAQITAYKFTNTYGLPDRYDLYWTMK